MYQVAKGVEAGGGAIVDVLESVKRLFRHLDIYTRIPHSLALDEMVIKIVMEMLSILALATKQLTRGQMSEFIFIDVLLYQTQCSEICKGPF